MDQINYQRALLQAVDAFLENTPPAIMRAQQLVKHCREALYSQFEGETLDELVWRGMMSALSDTLFTESETSLQHLRQVLRGDSSGNIARTVIREDYRPFFTPDEAEWQQQLLDMIAFLTAFPFSQIHEAFLIAQQRKSDSMEKPAFVAEARRLKEEGEAEYRRRLDHRW